MNYGARDYTRLDICDFGKYLRVVNRIPLLSLQEEKLFLLKLKNDKDILAVHYLVISHLRYVVKIAKNYLFFGFPLSDLVQEGTVGLLKSIKKYDLKKNVRLISFAVYWIKSEIFNYMIKNLSIVQSGLNNSMCSTKNLFIFKFCNIVDDSTELFLLDSKNDDSLSSFFYYFNKNGNFFFKNSFDSFELVFILKYLVFEILLKFDNRQKNIFFKRWFQLGCKNISRKFLSYYYNISNEYVRQLELKIIKKVRILLKFFL